MISLFTGTQFLLEGHATAALLIASAADGDTQVALYISLAAGAAATLCPLAARTLHT